MQPRLFCTGKRRITARSSDRRQLLCEWVPGTWGLCISACACGDRTPTWQLSGQRHVSCVCVHLCAATAGPYRRA